MEAFWLSGIEVRLTGWQVAKVWSVEKASHTPFLHTRQSGRLVHLPSYTRVTNVALKILLFNPKYSHNGPIDSSIEFKHFNKRYLLWLLCPYWYMQMAQARFCEWELTTGSVKQGNVHELFVVMYIDFSFVKLLEALSYSNETVPESSRRKNQQLPWALWG